MWAVNLSEPRITWCRWPKTARYQTYKVLYSVMSRTTHIIIHAAAERTASVNHVCKVKNAHGAVINTSPWTKKKRKKNPVQIKIQLSSNSVDVVSHIYLYIPMLRCSIRYSCVAWIYLFSFPLRVVCFTLLYSARPSIFNKALLWARQNNKSLD
jgi:hypothetical protein